MPYVKIAIKRRPASERLQTGFQPPIRFQADAGDGDSETSWDDQS